MFPFQLTDKYSQVESKLISAPWGHRVGGRGSSREGRTVSHLVVTDLKAQPFTLPYTQQQSLPMEDSVSPFPNEEGIAHTFVDKIQVKSPSSGS